MQHWLEQAVSREQSAETADIRGAKSLAEKAPRFLAVMLLLGATVGPAVDGIHGQVHLVSPSRNFHHQILQPRIACCSTPVKHLRRVCVQNQSLHGLALCKTVHSHGSCQCHRKDCQLLIWLQLQYDSAPVHLGSLESSVWVFVLLGAFYAVLGALYVLTDGLVTDGALLRGELVQHALCYVRKGVYLQSTLDALSREDNSQQQRMNPGHMKGLLPPVTKVPSDACLQLHQHRQRAPLCVVQARMLGLQKRQSQGQMCLLQRSPWVSWQLCMSSAASCMHRVSGLPSQCLLRRCLLLCAGYIVTLCSQCIL